MSLNQILDNGVTTPCLPWKKVKFYDVNACNSVISPEGDFDNVDVDTINGQPYPPGGGFLPTAVANKVLVTDNAAAISWGSVRPVNLTSGTTGQVIRTTAPSTVAWDNIVAGDITPGTANQVLVTNPTATAAVWSDSLALNGSFKVVGTAQTQGSLDIQDNLFLNTVAGTAGQYIKKTGATTQAWSDLDPADITPGTAFQTLQTNSLGTAPVWVDSIFAPGTISATGTLSSVNGGLTLSNVAAQINMLGAGTQINCGGIINTVTLNMTGALQFSAVAGTLGAVPVSNALGIPSWSFPTYFARYYDNSIVNMNSGGGTTLLTAATADVSNANITYLAGTFTLAEPGQYQVVFQTNPTSVSAKSQSYVKLIVNGVSRGSVLNASAVVNDVQSLSLIKTFRVNTTNATVAITTQQFAAGTLNTSGVDVDGIPTTLITITRLGPYV